MSDEIPKARRDYLLETVSSRSLINRIVETAEITAKPLCKGKRPEIKGCSRPVWVISIPQRTCDIFFNGVSGYRAAFLSSVEDGLHFNRSLLEALKDGLLSASIEAKLDPEFATASLAARSAKAWISEKFVTFDHEWHRHLLVVPWVEAARRYLLDKAKYTNCEQAVWGIRAPLGDEIEVKGAFLDNCWAERIPSDKKYRSEQIRDYGFS